MNVISYPPHVAPLTARHADAGSLVATESWSTAVLRTSWHWFKALCRSLGERLHQARRGDELKYLAESANHADLEERIRRLERHGFPPFNSR